MREGGGDYADTLFDTIHNRSRDKALSVRKEALSELAQVYKRNLQAAVPDYDKMTIAINAIMHMYYQPSNDDKWVLPISPYISIFSCSEYIFIASHIPSSNFTVPDDKLLPCEISCSPVFQCHKSGKFGIFNNTFNISLQIVFSCDLE